MILGAKGFDLCPLCRKLKTERRLICLPCSNDEYDAETMLVIADIIGLFVFLRDVSKRSR